MSNASDISICANALQRLGTKPIASFQENSTFAGPCSNLWPTVRNAILRAHPWNCATKRAILAPLAEAPPFDYAYQFQLPTDWLKTVQVGRRNCPMDFVQEGRRILARSNQLPLVWIWENQDAGTWDDSMVEAAEILMASALAYTVTKSTSLRDSLNQEGQFKLKVAKSIDGQDQPPEEFPDSALTMARF